MKALQCELCGSTDIVKDGDFFVCQACGMKYTLETVKKMMIEGTVKIDKTDDAEKFLKLARESVSSGNYVKAEEYSDKTLEVDPDNMEAWHIRARAIDWQSTIANDRTTESVKSYEHYVELLANTVHEGYDRTGFQTAVGDLLMELETSSEAQVRLLTDPFSTSWSNVELITDGVPYHIEVRACIAKKLVIILTKFAGSKDGISIDDANALIDSVDRTVSAMYRFAQIACNNAALSGANKLEAAWQKINPFEYWTDGPAGAVEDVDNEAKQFDICRKGLDDASSAFETAIELWKKSTPGIEDFEPGPKIVYENMIYTMEYARDLTSSRKNNVSGYMFFNTYMRAETKMQKGFSLTDEAKKVRNKHIDAAKKAEEALDPECLRKTAQARTGYVKQEYLHDVEQAMVKYDNQHGITALNQKISDLKAQIESGTDELKSKQKKLDGFLFAKKREQILAETDELSRNLESKKSKLAELVLVLEKKDAERPQAPEQYISNDGEDERFKIILIGKPCSWIQEDGALDTFVKTLKETVGSDNVMSKCCFENAYPDNVLVVQGLSMDVAGDAINVFDEAGAIAYVEKE